MAFGLPSAEQMRDYLISQGVDPAVATERANVAARQNAAQAARTSALSLVAGAAPARATGAAAVEAAPAIARSVMGVGERIAAAPRQAWEFLTKPAEVLRNPSTGNLIQNVAPRTGAPLPRPDLKWGSKIPVFTPAQRAAQGTAGGLALGAGTAGVGAMAERPTVEPLPMPPADGTISGEGYGNRYDQAMSDGSVSGEQYGERANMLAAKALGEAAGLPMRRPSETSMQRAIPMPPTRPVELAREQPSILSKIFSGQDYQSNSRPVNEPMGGAPVNWGSSDSAADFFRADKALMAKRQEEEGRARGGAANAKPDSLHKALEIIHHLLTRSH